MIAIWLTLYLGLAMLAAFPITAAVDERAEGPMDREDLLVILIGSLIWPLVGLAVAWWHGYQTYRRAEVNRRLRRYGADLEETHRD